MAIEIPQRYFLHIDCQGVELQVRINDIPILDTNYGRPLSCNLPGNLHLISGENLLQARFSPPPGASAIPDSAEISLTLCRKGKDEPDEALKEMTRLHYRPSSDPVKKPPTLESSPSGVLDAVTLKPATDGTIKIGEPSDSWNLEKLEATVERTITMPLPFGEAHWLKADKLNPNDETFLTLYEEYKRFWEILNARNTFAAYEYLQSKIQAVAAAWGYGDEEARDAIKIGNMLTHNGIELQPLRSQDLDIEIFGYGHLARIIDRDGDSPIYFREKDGSLEHYIEMIYCLEGGQPKPCR